MAKRKLTIALIGRGLTDWHAASIEDGSEVSISGAELLDTPWHAGGVKRGLLQDAPVGTPAYDAAHLNGEPRAFIAWVCGPSNGAFGYTPESAARVIASLRVAVPGIKLGVVLEVAGVKRIVWEDGSHT